MTAAFSTLPSHIARCPQLQLSDSCSLYPDRQHAAALSLLKVKNDRCEAVISVQGAQLLSFQPAHGKPLLWLSPKAIFQPGKAIRGGIPLCLPWFGPHADDPSKPQHGFARNRDWTLLDAEAVDTGTTRLVWELRYPDPVADRSPPADPLLAGAFRAQLVMVLSDRIDLELEVENTGNQAFPLSWALHSYHPAADIAAAAVSGLEECEWWDNADRATPAGQKVKQLQSGAVAFNGEVDRVYINVPAAQQLHCGGDTLTIRGKNCASAVIWNPGAALATSMADVGAEHYQEFVCVERGNTAENSCQLAPGEIHRAWLTITRD